MKVKKFILASVTLFSTTLLAYATALDPEVVLQNIVNEIYAPAYKFMVGISALYFLFGVVKYIYDMRNPSDKAVGKDHLLWGTIGLFIVFSVGGILRLFGSMFDGLFIY